MQPHHVIVSTVRRRRAAKNSAAPTRLSQITTPEIFTEKLSQLATSMIGKIESTTYNSVTANPDAAAMRSQNDGLSGDVPQADERNREHHQVRQSIENPRGILEELKRLLFADAGDADRAERQRHETRRTESS